VGLAHPARDEGKHTTHPIAGSFNFDARWVSAAATMDVLCSCPFGVSWMLVVSTVETPFSADHLSLSTSLDRWGHLF